MPLHGSDGSVQDDGTVETFGKRGKRIHVAEFSVSTSEANLQQRSTQLAYEITAAYGEVFAERHKLKLLGDLIDLNKAMLRLTEARVKEGYVAPLEANLLRVEISRVEVYRRTSSDKTLPRYSVSAFLYSAMIRGFSLGPASP